MKNLIDTVKEILTQFKIKIIKVIVYAICIYLYLIIFIFIGGIHPLLWLLFIAINILVLYMNGTFIKMKIKSKIQKENGKVKFVAKISLSKGTDNSDLTEFNTQNFDKTMLGYKKYLLFLTTSSLIIVGYNSFKDKVEQTYQKDFDLKKIDEILIGYNKHNWTEKGYEKQRNYKKVWTDTGRSYVEETEENVPYEVAHQDDVLTYSQINFKNTLVNSVLYGFTNGKQSVNLANKLIKVCNKLNIKCQTILDEE